MKNLLATILVVMAMIFAVPTTVATATTGVNTTALVQYDLNENGRIDNEDFELMKRKVFNNENNEEKFRIADMVIVKKEVDKASNMTAETGKAVVGYNFKGVKSSDESINFIRNSLFNCELISIKYEAGTFILEDNYTVTYLMFEQTTENPPEGDNVVITFPIEGKKYIVWTESGSFKVAEKYDIGKAAIGYDFKTIKPSDESINFIRNSLCNCELISIKYEAGTFILEDNYMVTYLMFEQTTENPPEGDNIIIAFPLTDGSVQVIYIDESGNFAVSESK